jgi:hypothetical protein
MPISKKKNSTLPLRRLVAWLFGPGRTGVLIVLLLGAFVGAAWWGWVKLQPRILGTPEYRIGPEQVEITPPPAWIHTDIRAAVFRSPTLDGPLSLLDADLVPRITNAFASHPWVAKVTRVSPHHPASVKVELVYRKPACMIKVPRGLLPVDAEGVLLPFGPEDFTSTEAATQYLAVRDVDREPTGPVGSRWGDARVLGGAEIAAAIGDAWKSLRLYSIVPQTDDSAVAAGRLSEPVFWLTAATGSRIRWGYAPGASEPEELPAAEKVARLKRYFADHDTFDGPQGRWQDLDLRTMPPSVRP